MGPFSGGEIEIMEKTRFSVREKKILLFLRQTDGREGWDGWQSIKTIFALDPIKTRSGKYKDGQPWKYSYRSEDSIRRTLLRLRKKGYVKNRRGARNWTFYKLTPSGRVKADELNIEITAYIEEWQTLVSQVTVRGPVSDIKA